MDKPEFKRKSWLSELKSLTQEYCYDFIDNKSGSLLKVFGFPIIAGIAIKVIAGKTCSSIMKTRVQHVLSSCAPPFGAVCSTPFLQSCLKGRISSSVPPRRIFIT